MINQTNIHLNPRYKDIFDMLLRLKIPYDKASDFTNEIWKCVEINERKCSAIELFQIRELMYDENAKYTYINDFKNISIIHKLTKKELKSFDEN